MEIYQLSPGCGNSHLTQHAAGPVRTLVYAHPCFACVNVWSTRVHTCGRRDVSSSKPERMHIPHGKESPYLTGQSYLIDTRRVPNTSRPPIRHPLLSPSVSSISLLSCQPFHAARISFSLAASRSESRIRICSTRRPISRRRRSNHGNGNTSYACNVAPRRTAPRRADMSL